MFKKMLAGHVSTSQRMETHGVQLYPSLTICPHDYEKQIKDQDIVQQYRNRKPVINLIRSFFFDSVGYADNDLRTFVLICFLLFRHDEVLVNGSQLQANRSLAAHLGLTETFPYVVKITNEDDSPLALVRCLTFDPQYPSKIVNQRGVKCDIRR